MRVLLIVLLGLVFLEPLSAQCTSPAIIVDGEQIVNVQAITRGDRVNIWFDPVAWDGSDDHCWRWFHLYVDGEFAYAYHWEWDHVSTGYQQQYAASPDNPFGTADSSFFSWWPDEEGTFALEVRAAPNPTPGSSVPNPLPSTLALVERVGWTVSFGDALIPSDGSPVLIPVILTPDEDCTIAGWSFAYLFDDERITISGHTSSTWTGNDTPTLDGLPLGISVPVDLGAALAAGAPSFWAPFFHNEDGLASGEFYEGGFGWTTCLVSFSPQSWISLQAGQPLEAMLLEVAAKPGAPDGPVSISIESWDDSFEVPSYVNTKVSSIGYTRPASPSVIQEYPHSAGWAMEWGPFELMAPGFVQPTWVIGEAEPFQPGDMDSSGSVGLTDAIAMLQFLFQGVSVPCERTVDANLDQAMTLTDPIFALQYAFASGPEPYPGCMVAPTVDCAIGTCP